MTEIPNVLPGQPDQVTQRERVAGSPGRIDGSRLQRDHGLTPGIVTTIKQNIAWPDVFVVPTGTDLKPNLASELFTRVIEKPQDVDKRSASSGISEQPVGAETMTGADNRLAGAEAKVREEQETPGSPFHGKKVGFIVVENGIFKGVETPEGLTLDQSQEFDQNATYYDAAVITIRLPDGRTVTKVSPPSEAVAFPREDVLEAHRRGFDTTTVGSVIAERGEREGLAIDKQDPHSYLTKDRPDGSFSRYQQLAGAMVDGFKELAAQPQQA